jgi:hypothetical protein
MKKYALFLLCLALSACAHHYNAPDNSAVIAASQQLHQRIAEAKVHATAARVAVSAAKVIADSESDIIKADAVKITDLLKAAPPELREEINALRNDNIELARQNAEQEQRIAEAQTHQAALDAKMGDEIPKAEDQLAKVGGDYFGNVNALADKATQESAKKAWWAKKALTSWLWWIVGIVFCLAGIGVFVFSWLVKIGLIGGKVAAEIAAKIP